VLQAICVWCLFFLGRVTLGSNRQSDRDATEFLTVVSKATNVSTDLKLEAIKALAKRMARKITKPTLQPGSDLAARLEAANKRLGRGIQRDQ
jgi:hypothetical protein